MKIPSSTEFKNKPDGWETTAKAQDGSVWEMSQREEDILIQEFERRIAFSKFQVCQSHLHLIAICTCPQEHIVPYMLTTHNIDKNARKEDIVSFLRTSKEFDNRDKYTTKIYKFFIFFKDR